MSVYRPIPFQGKVQLKPKSLQQLKSGHPWIFSGAIARLEAKDAGLVTIVDHEGSFLGTGFYNPNSQIAVRRLSLESIDNLESWFSNKLEMALQNRHVYFPQAQAVRLVFGEADGLPGLIVDRFQKTISFQCNSLFAQEMKPLLLAYLRDQGMLHFWDASDTSMRQRERILDATSGWITSHPDAVIFHEGPARFSILSSESTRQKTGFYLDQRYNRQLVAQYAKGDVLDICCYSGGFAIQAALLHRNNQTTCVDASESALSDLKHHITLNQLDSAHFQLMRSDMFQALGKLQAEGKQFDAIILDPPKLIKAKAQKAQGLRGYRHLNKMAMKVLKPGGHLISFSCSGTVNAAEFEHTVHEACWEANCHMQMLHTLRQDHDHPIVTFFPESLYLKGCILRKL